MNLLLFLVQFISTVPITAVLVFVLLKLVARFRRSGEAGLGLGRAVLVTGCDSGFGHRLAGALDRGGFVVFAGCLSPDGDGAQSLVRDGSGNLKVLQLDVTKEEEVQQARKTVQENLPEEGLWAVVNNAGISDWAEIEWSSLEDFRHMADVNLFGSIRTTIAFLPLVRAAKGRVVFVSSIFAFFHCLNMGAYSVSKRGLEAFADCLRVEMASFGVKEPAGWWKFECRVYLASGPDFGRAGSNPSVSIIQPGNFAGATNILKTKTASDIWAKLDDDRKVVFNRRYVELANDYFKSTCKTGFKTAEPVVTAMLHALTSTRPKSRYLLVSALDKVFFKLYPLLPTVFADSVFSFSSMYKTRKQMLFNQ
ncbi:D-beta-hydroxybutyrate dehydrogenase, mitochondrial isoform X1 [Oryzias latipes]|uniref:D-beta-hydroxybutyrate dehydrogenase, mitochondrial isoform X1 n=1 Tax=Oryzias latipes TaxID=8090 RepID=UPI000CE1F93D|nr:D-beta-hydroxybutyrate dehydrogenase, mitochondrial isoform X1 [Oryzias latipes]